MLAPSLQAGLPWPLISVRMPSYNHRDFIERALTSVIEDSYPNKELVIVDDASTDGTDQFLRAWISAHQHLIAVKYVARTANQGIVRTINQALSLCEGEYIASLASDDYLLADGLLKRYQFLRDHPGKMAVFADCIVVDSAGRLMAESGLTKFYKADLQRFKSPAGIRKEFISNWSVPGPVLMVHRDVFSIVGSYDESRIIEDWDFYLRLATAELLGFLEAKVSAYRVHGSNTCMNADRKIGQLTDMQNILRKHMPAFTLAERLRAMCKYLEIAANIRLTSLTKAFG